VLTEVYSLPVTSCASRALRDATLTSPWGSLAQDTSGSPSNNKELIEEPVLRYTLPHWQRSTLCCTGRNPTAPLGLLPSRPTANVSAQPCAPCISAEYLQPRGEWVQVPISS